MKKKDIILCAALTVIFATLGVLIATGVIAFKPHRHTWKPATCTTIKVCTECGFTDGDKPTGHDWQRATCSDPRTCSKCQETQGKPSGHKWKAETCTSPKTCRICAATEGEPLGHTWLEDGTCETCHKTKSEVSEQDNNQTTNP